VRRAFLCGVDGYTGQSYEHRKVRLEDRIRLVAEGFDVAIHAYAVMSNHLHLVLRIDPSETTTWHDNDVVARWVRLFPPRLAPGKRGRITPHAPAILKAMGDHDAKRWATRVAASGSGWYRVTGSAQDLIEIAERLGQQWLKGVRLALTLG
jgi:hypothetical protein